jgi:uncharacterized protein (UPF0303 family)
MTDPKQWQTICDRSIAEESTIDFDRFGYEDAWTLGSAMVARAAAEALPVAIAIVFGEQRVFHAALHGSAATNDDWLARKFATVAKHGCSSWAQTCRARAEGGDFFADGGYDPRDLALAGGAVPLRVRGSLIGAVGVSGLAEEDDHRLVVESLRAFLKR